MRFTPTPLAGAYLVDLEPAADDRGFFARAFCAEEFKDRGLAPTTAQANLSFNHKRGTLRGLHYQVAPGLEAKFMRCVSGAIYDVIRTIRRS